MRYINILKVLFKEDIPNPNAFVHLKEENEQLHYDLNEELEKRLGYGVNKEVLAEMSLNLLLLTHDTSEIIELLETFNQLNAGGK